MDANEKALIEMAGSMALLAQRMTEIEKDLGNFDPKMEKALRDLNTKVDKISDTFDKKLEEYVHELRFNPIEKIVYGLVFLVLGGVVSGILALVIGGPGT